LAENEIQNLKVKDFVGHQDEDNVTTLKLRRIKTEVDFITFLNSEATRAVQDYINFRNREPVMNDEGSINHSKKQKIYSPNNYLFIHRYVLDEFLKTKDDKLRCFKEGTFEHIYNYISARAQISTPKGDYNLIRSHNMRKYFNTALKSAGCDNFHVEFWVGAKAVTPQIFRRGDGFVQQSLVFGGQ